MAQCPKCKRVWNTLPGEEQDHDCPRGHTPFLPRQCEACGEWVAWGDACPCGHREQGGTFNPVRREKLIQGSPVGEGDPGYRY
jgi:hypothetical protein